MLKNEKRFEVSPLESQGNVLTHIITDEKTGVQYLLAISPNVGSGMVMLVDEEGNPLLGGRG